MERQICLGIGDDSNLGCSTWPEIRREALEPKPLPEDERQELKQILQYTGPRKMSALLDRSVLRLHGISSVPPSSHDESRAHNITFRGLAGRMVWPGSATEEGTSEEPEGALTRPAKRKRRESVPGQTLPVRGGAETTAVGRGKVITGAAPSSVVGFRRTWQKKVSHGPRGARRLGESIENSMEAGSSESGEWDDDRHPIEAEEEKVGLQAFGVAPQATAAVTPEEAGGRSEHEAVNPQAAPSRELPRRLGKEPVVGQETSFVPAGWPSPYYIAETDGDWDKVSDLMIGALPTYGRHEGELDAEYRYRPAEHMDIRSSVLRSRHL